MKKYKLAIIGLGKFGQKYVETIDRDFKDQIELVAACRQKNEKPEWLPENCQFYTNYDQIFDNLDNQKWIRGKDIDGIIVATEPNNHCVLTYLAHTYQIPIMAEKPICIDIAQLEVLVNTEICSVLVNYIHLFAPAFIKLQEQIDQAKFSIITKGYNNGPIREFSSLWDYGVHDLAMILSITKQYPIGILCSKDPNKELYTITLDFGNGRNSSSMVGNDAENKERKLIVNMGHKTITYDDTIKYNNQYDSKLMKNEVLRNVRARAIGVAPIKYDDKIKPLNNSISNFLNLIDDNYDKDDLRFGLKLTEDITKILVECERQTSIAV